MAPLFIVALLTLAIPAQDADTKARFSRALGKLGSDDYAEREAASEQLAGLPEDALGLVETELKKDVEPEVRSRLQRARDQLKSKGKRLLADRRKEAVHAWDTKTAVDAYEKVGRKDAKWDAKVRSALPMLVQIWEGNTSTAQMRAIYDLLSEAVTAGCDDPLVLYGRARMYHAVIRKSMAEAAALHQDAARAMAERGTRYHPLRRGMTFARAAEFIVTLKKDLTDDDKAKARDWLDQSLKQMAEAASDLETPESLLRDWSTTIVTIEMTLGADRKAGFDKVYEMLTKGRPASTLPLVLKGEIYTKYAWDARGNGWANTVTPDGWKKMAERLEVAETALTEAWKKNPDDPEAPTLMLGVELGQAKGRGVMETWYKRAMEADPNNYAACTSKLYYLEPKWHGNEQAMLGFGRELLAGGNWEGRLPFVLVDAHWELSQYGDKPEDYYKNPEVWKDLQSIYEPYLRKHSDSAWDRSFYARYAAWCEQWSVAKAQFDRLGDAVLVQAFKDQAELTRLRAEAAEKGK